MENCHACLIYAESIETSSIPVEYKTQSADVLHILRERFGINDARELVRLAQQQPFVAKKRSFIIATNDVAVEAQNALLKLFEEPPHSAEFYIVTKKTAFLLPTLMSRLYIFDIREEDISMNDIFKSFLDASYAERMALIVEKTKAKDIAWVEQVVEGCEVWVSNTPENKMQLLRTLVFIRKYLASRGSSTKMLLEELALILPTK